MKRIPMQYYVFSEEDKQAYMLQFSEEEKMVWLRGVQMNATKLVRYDIPAEARFFFQRHVFGPVLKDEEYQANLGFGATPTKCVMNM